MSTGEENQPPKSSEPSENPAERKEVADEKVQVPAGKISGQNAKNDVKEKGKENVDEDADAQPTLEDQVTALHNDLDRLKAKHAEEMKEQRSSYKYLQAEFENFRKRQARQQEQWRKSTERKIFQSFLPFVDSFEQAIEKTSDPDKPPSQEALLDGLRALHRKLHELLRQYQIVPMDALDKPFDYNKHEVMMQQVVDEDVPEDHVVGVAQPGWMMGKDVLRHARVVVSKHAPKPQPEVKGSGKADDDAGRKDGLDEPGSSDAP